MARTPPPYTPKRQRVNNKGNLVKLLEGLLPGTRSKQELAEHAGVHYHTVCDFLPTLHKAGLVHIASWRKDGRGMDRTALWQLGPGVDAPRRRLTEAQRQANYKRRQEAKAEASQPLPTNTTPLVRHNALDLAMRSFAGAANEETAQCA